MPEKEPTTTYEKTAETQFLVPVDTRMWLAGTATDADVYAFRGNTNGLTAEAVRIGGRLRYADAMIAASRKEQSND